MPHRADLAVVSADLLHSSAAVSAGPITLAELLDAEALEEVIRSHAEFHGVGLALVDLDGRVLLSGGAADPLCDVVRSFGSGRERCDAKLREVRASTATGACDCFTGLRYQAAPLELDRKVLGILLLGPYKPADKPPGLTGPVLSIVGSEGLARAAAAVTATRSVSDEQARRIVDQIARVIGVLLRAAYMRHLTAKMHLETIEKAYAELAEKNRRLGEAIERLEEVDRLKSNFLATVSHELRTPLTSVIGYSEMLLEGLAGPLNEEQREYVQTIMEKGDQLLQLISAILDVSRIEAGTLRVAREPVDLDDLIGVAVAAVAPLARKKRLELHVMRAPGTPRVLGDRDKIRQVLVNLLGNAIKFTPEGGTIEIRTDVGALGDGPAGEASSPVASGSTAPAQDGAGGLGIRLCVRDTGIGIAKEQQARIFEPFFQVDSSSTREYGGTGLGLALVKSFVEAHGGRVWVESDLGRGSLFTVTLPAVDEDLTSYLKQRSP